MQPTCKGKTILFSMAWILWTCVFVEVIAAQNTQQSDVEKGRVALGQACVRCHNLGPIQNQRKSAEKWRDTVYSMISRGGMIFPEEIEPLTAYLTATFGPNSPPPSSPTGASRAADDGPAALRLPEGEGRAILQRSCVQCHDLQTAIGKTASREEWSQILSRMVGVGASVTAAEQQTLIQYLSGLVR
jgi:mono/diheme cytochrome c family protein